jgi:ABC-type lipoprotein release transport system permease subunit
VFGLALVAIIGPALAACLLPARKAARVDPIEALRQ